MQIIRTYHFPSVSLEGLAAEAFVTQQAYIERIKAAFPEAACAGVIRTETVITAVDGPIINGTVTATLTISD